LNDLNRTVYLLKWGDNENKEVFQPLNEDSLVLTDMVINGTSAMEFQPPIEDSLMLTVPLLKPDDKPLYEAISPTPPDLSFIFRKNLSKKRKIGGLNACDYRSPTPLNTSAHPSGVG
jgi:hypothetical protein